MQIINPETIVAIIDDENKTTSTVMCRVPVGRGLNGDLLFQHQKQTVSRNEADKLALFLLKKDKDADALREGLKPGRRKK